MILEHLVISLGVTDKGITDKVKRKDRLESAELSAILKVRFVYKIGQALGLMHSMKR